jgi:hypothetical protein
MARNKNAARNERPLNVKIFPGSQEAHVLDEARAIVGPSASVAAIVRAAIRLLDERIAVSRTAAGEAALLRLILAASAPRQSGQRSPLDRLSPDER